MQNVDRSSGTRELPPLFTLLGGITFALLLHSCRLEMLARHRSQTAKVGAESQGDLPVRYSRIVAIRLCGTSARLGKSLNLRFYGRPVCAKGQLMHHDYCLFSPDYPGVSGSYIPHAFQLEP